MSTLGTWKWKVSPCIYWPAYNTIDYPQANIWNSLTDKYFTITLLDPCIDSTLNLASIGIDQGPCVPVTPVAGGKTNIVIDQGLIPYFDSWDEIYNEWNNVAIELSTGEEYEFFFPDAFDCCGNDIEIKVNLRDATDVAKW